MGVENVYSIMLPDNYRALSLTKKMGFSLEYLPDGTVKGVLHLKESESLMEIPEAEPKESFKEENEKVKQQPETAAAPT
jgi:hypothetical protein